MSPRSHPSRPHAPRRRFAFAARSLAFCVALAASPAGVPRAQDIGSLLGMGTADPTGTTAGSARRASGFAQPAMRPQSGAVDPATYVLGPGDGLTLHLWGPISDEIPIEVGPEGRAFLREMGPLRLAGLTLEQARAAVASLVRRHYRGVRSDLTLDRVRAMTVYLTGELKVVGPVVVAGGSRVADAIVDTMFTPGASHRNITVRRQSGGTESVDLGRFELTGVDPHPLLLRDGDVISVPKATRWTGAWGGVARPGRYELGPRDSLLTLLELAGGLVPSAIRDRVLHVRHLGDGTTDSVWIDFGDMEQGRANPPLSDADQLYVYYQPSRTENPRVSVIGHVQRSGDYPIQPGISRLSDAIRVSGGFREGADLSAIRLLRIRPEVAKNDPEFTRLSQLSREEMTESEYASFRTRLAALTPDFRVDWERLGSGDRSLDPLLLEGDIVRVDRLDRTVRVDGQVRAPGVFEFVPGAPWEHYVRLAGGYTTASAGGKTRITRAVNGQTALARNVLHVEPGDFLWVPERADVTSWQRFTSLITVAAQAATIYLAFRR